MRAYTAVTGAIFILLVGAHFLRIVDEGLGPLRDPIFVVTSLLSLAMALWASRTWKQLRKQR